MDNLPVIIVFEYQKPSWEISVVYFGMQMKSMWLLNVLIGHCLIGPDKMGLDKMAELAK